LTFDSIKDLVVR